MKIETWNEFRTAYVVAEIGTVSGAAESLGVHRSTVMRHIDTLESRLGAKIFHRHSRGYSPTELGAALIEAGSKASNVISDFMASSQLHNAQINGELVLSGGAPLSPLLVSIAGLYQQRHPDTVIRIKSTHATPRLEYGESHVHFYMGDKPSSLDYVVKPGLSFLSGLYAHQSYIREYGKPNGIFDLAGHRIVLIDNSFDSRPSSWLRERVAERDIAFEGSTPSIAFRAILDGVGIGVLPTILADDQQNIETILEPIPDCEMQLWIVTHVDIHRTPKLQAFIQCLRDVNVIDRPATDCNISPKIAL